MQVLSNRLGGTGLALLAALCFAVNAPMAKLVMESGLSPAALSQLRSAGAAALLIGALLIWKPAALRCTRRELPLLIMSGVTGGALMHLLYFTAISRLPVGIAVLIEFTAPVLIALWVRFGLPRRHRRAVPATTWPALALVIIGLMAVAQVWSGFRLDVVGVLAASAGAVCFATYYLLQEHTGGTRGPVAQAAWILGGGAVFWAVVRPWWEYPGSQLTGSHEGTPVWLLCVGVIVVGTIAPYLLIAEALRHSPATMVSLAGTAEPILAAGAAWIVLSEQLGWAQVIGGLVVVAGIALAQVRPKPAAAPEQVGVPVLA